MSDKPGDNQPEVLLNPATATATGEPSKGGTSREYRFELNGRFLTARNKSVYEPKTPTAKPEVHAVLAMFSYDHALKKIV